VERSRAGLNDNKSRVVRPTDLAKRSRPRPENVKARICRTYAVRAIKYNEKMSRQAFNYDLTRFLRRGVY